MELPIPLETAPTEMIGETPCGVGQTRSAMKPGVTTEATPSAVTATHSATGPIVTTAAIRRGAPRIPSAIRFAAKSGPRFDLVPARAMHTLSLLHRGHSVSTWLVQFVRSLCGSLCGSLCMGCPSFRSGQAVHGGAIAGVSADYRLDELGVQHQPAHGACQFGLGAALCELVFEQQAR